MELQQISNASYFDMLSERNKQEAELLKLKTEQLKIVIAINRKYADVRKEINLQIPIEHKDTAGMKYDDPAFKIATQKQQQRELLIAAQMGQEMLAMQVQIPAAMKINMEAEARRQYDIIANFINNRPFMQQWIDNKLMTAEEVTQLQAHFMSFESWQLTPAKTKHDFLKKIYGVTDAGIGLLIQEEFTRSWYGRSLGWLTNLSTMAMLVGVTGIGGWDVLLQFAITNALYPMSKMLATGAAIFFGIPQDNFIARNHQKLVTRITAAQNYTSETFAGMGAWTQSTFFLSAGGIVFFTALLGLSAPALMFMCAPLWPRVSIMLQASVITPLFKGISPAIIKGLELAYEPAKAAAGKIVGYGASAGQFGFDLAYKHNVVGTSVLSLTILAPLMLLGVNAATGGQLVSITKTLFFVGIGASILTVAAASPLLWTAMTPVVSGLLANLMHTTMLRYGVSIASSWAFVGVYYVRNGLTRHLERKLKTSKSPNLARLQYILRRWAPVLDALVHIMLIGGTTALFSQNIYLSYNNLLAAIKLKL
jgi:hypothetical protein